MANVVVVFVRENFPDSIFNALYVPPPVFAVALQVLMKVLVRLMAKELYFGGAIRLTNLANWGVFPVDESPGLIFNLERKTMTTVTDNKSRLGCRCATDFRHTLVPNLQLYSSAGGSITLLIVQ